jgi:hypothetical protein
LEVFGVNSTLGRQLTLRSFYLSILAALSLALMPSAALAGGNHGNGQGPPSGNGNVCQPGYHGEPGGSSNCVHNGDGAGNCGQNQSNNTGHGAGNGGNDNGYGHKPGCDETPSSPPPCQEGYKPDKHGNCVPCPPPPCKPGTHEEHGKCVPDTPPPPPCPTGTHKENGTCVPDTPPPPPPVTTPPPSTTITVINNTVVTPGPTQVIVVNCPSCCPPKAGHKPPHKRVCPKVKKSQFKVSFTPKHLKHGNLHLRARAPKSAHVRKITTKIYSRWHGRHYAKKYNSKPNKTYVNKGSKLHRVLPLWRTDIWGHGLWGRHKVVVTFYLQCGKKVVVTMRYFNLDPPKGIVIRNGRPVVVGA